jgi:hypothetical protein
MFKWLVVARRPLSVDEVKEGIAFTLDDQEWDRQKIPSDLKRLIRACGNLVIVETDSQIVTLGKLAIVFRYETSRSKFCRFSFALISSTLKIYHGG